MSFRKKAHFGVWGSGYQRVALRRGEAESYIRVRRNRSLYMLHCESLAKGWLYIVPRVLAESAAGWACVFLRYNCFKEAQQAIREHR